MENIFDGLIEFESKKHLEDFLEKMDKPLAIKLIEGSIDMSIRNGVFSLEETYCLYKCLSKLKEDDS